jgi:hypothetical protein
MKKPITFYADKVAIQTGRIDNSGIVKFEVGEYQIEAILELAKARDVVLKVTVEIDPPEVI